ncbi:MAG: methylmalonyl Co-A mutase-associated GTPase MeaB, partial [Chloroflexi bacterium]|nr:methylmalonyl Co-A mutase-associated GTPase MeaB [Chloroflexota bacterium]
MTRASQRLLAGDKRALSQVISLLERHDPATSQVLKEIDPHTGGAYTVGITGPPGAGKSTIVDRLTELLRQQGLTVGILGVDPSSPFTGGALLGDRIRMQRHYLDSGVFIRSVATRGQSGGLPRIIKGMVRLLDAAGTDLVLVETVGVGQSELGIMGVADTVVVTLMPESGDAIQTLKAGIMEIADLYVVNKADRDGSEQMATTIRAMLQMAPTQPDWTPPVVLTQARSG